MTETETSFASVWDAIETDPAEAENMKIRASLLRAIIKTIQANAWSQAECARRLGVNQPRVSDLMRGKIDRFSIDALANFAHQIGLRLDIRIDQAA